MTVHPKCTLLRKNELIVGRWIWCRTVSTECAVWSVRCTLELDVETCNIWALELLHSLHSAVRVEFCRTTGFPAQTHCSALLLCSLTSHYPLSLPKPLFLSLPTKPLPTTRTSMQPGCQQPLSCFSKHEEEFFAFCTIFGRCSQMRSANGRNNDTVERHRLFCFVREARSTYWPCRFALSLWHLNRLASPTAAV